MHAQEDVSPYLGKVIWAYFIGLAIALYLLIGALSVYFEMRLEKERLQKVGMVESEELNQQREHEQQVLTGALGVVEGKKHIAIDEAVDRYVAQLRVKQGPR